MKYLDQIIPIEQYITGNKIIRLCEKHDIVFAKTDFVEHGIAEVLAKPNATAFVTHQSDYGITERFKNRLPSSVTWFAENCEVGGDPNFVGIPNGLNNVDFVVSEKSKWGRYSSNFAHLCDFHGDLARQNAKPKQESGLVYMNFTADNSPTERTHVYNLFKDRPWVTKKHGLSHEEFCSDVHSHPFVLSPRGNGYDCVRTWESIYLRSIPIIKRNNVMEHFKQLPILFVDSWEEVTESFLVEKLVEFRSRDFSMEMATIDYWDRILASYKHV